MSYPHPRLKLAPSIRGHKKPEGRQWEEDFFQGARIVPAIGFTGAPPKYDDAVQSVIDSGISCGWDPRHPRGPYALTAFGAVRRKLPNSQAHQLELYCAVGTYLDVAHGADGFFTLSDDPVGFAVGIDLRVSWNRMIDNTTILVTKKQFRERLDRVANLIAQVINTPRLQRQRFIFAQSRRIE